MTRETPVPAHLSRGTLVLAVVTNHGAYLAADSHGTNPPSDDNQKIFQFGPCTFLAVTGHLFMRHEVRSAEGRTLCSGTLNLLEVLRAASSGYAGDGTDLAVRLKGKIHEMLKPYWDLFVARSFSQVLAAAPGVDTFCEIPILTRAGGLASVSTLQFPFSPDGNLLEPIVKPGFRQTADSQGEAFTWGADVGDGFEPSLDSRDEVLGFVADLYDRAACLHPDTVGGPTDIGVIDDQGARWLARKRNLD